MATEEPPAPAPAAAAEEDAAPEPAVAIDPCDPKRMMFDSIDLLAYEIITNPSKRAERKGQLEVGVFRLGIICTALPCMAWLGLAWRWGFGGKSNFASKQRAEGRRCMHSFNGVDMFH